MSNTNIEKLILEATKNLLDQDKLGLPKSEIENPGSATFQFQYENINDLFSVKILKDSEFTDSHTTAFRKVHSYKYLEDPTFEAAYASELRSMGIPKEEIELGLTTIQKVREEILDGNSENVKGWADNLDDIIQTTKEGGNGKSAEENTPFTGIEPDNTRPTPIKVESKRAIKIISESSPFHNPKLEEYHNILINPNAPVEQKKLAWDQMGILTGDTQEFTTENLQEYIDLTTK